MNIDEKITALKAVFDAQTEAVGGLYDDREQLQVELNELRSRIDSISEPFAEQARTLESEIKAEVLELGKKYEHPLAKVAYTKESKRSIWDAAALKAYSKVHPEISEMKKVSVTPARVSIKWI